MRIIADALAIIRRDVAPYAVPIPPIAEVEGAEAASRDLTAAE